jgi:hypothetical protein
MPTITQHSCGNGTMVLGPYAPQTPQSQENEIVDVLPVPTTVSFLPGGGAGSFSYTLITAKAMTRSQLLPPTTPKLRFNVSFIAESDDVASHWALLHVTTIAGATLLFVTEARGAKWTVYVVDPPGGSNWISDSVSMFADTTVGFNATFSCSLDPAVLSVTMMIPAPGVARQLASSVHVSAKSVQIMSVFARGEAGASVGRMLARGA